MTYTRVLGTIGLIGVTVLGATGPMHASTTAHASPAAAARQKVTYKAKLSPVAAKAAALQTLRRGYFVTRNNKRVYLSSALTNAFAGVGGKAKASGAVSAAHASASVPPTTNPNVRANQDFGYYQTGNGQLFHNTESVAVDPVSPLHVVVSATDTRLGSDGAVLNYSSNPVVNGAFSPNCFTDIGGVATPTPCSLIQALGGPGVYNSVDAAKSFTDLIIPDMLTGAVPNAINTAVAPAAIAEDESAATEEAVDADPLINAAVGCIPPSGAFTAPGFQTPGTPTGCLPYDSVGDQSVAFDSVGNLYDVSLGLVSTNPIPFSGAYDEAPQTDVVLNVSPAVQPVGSATGPYTPPNAAGKVFNSLAPTPTCNPTNSSTTLCLHNEVIASTSASNQLLGFTDGVNPDAGLVGRNWQADYGQQLFFGPGPTGQGGYCGTLDFCLADQPYLAINGVVDPVAYVTYTVFDFSILSSNIYLTTATVPSPAGSLPAWSAPATVDNTLTNPYCLAPANPNGICFESWGAEPTVGPDGAVYIAYENGDFSDTTNTPIETDLNNAILVASIAGGGSITVGTTTFVAEALDHDAYNAAISTDPVIQQDPAGLDPASGAYFTIPNRPTIAVTGPTTIGGKSYPGGVLIVAWTDQRSIPGLKLANATFSAGTRVWYALGVVKSSQPLAFNLVAPTNAITLPTTAVTAPLGTYTIAEVNEPNIVANQFFPWVTAAQTAFGTGINDNIFLGYYQEVPSAAGPITNPGATTPASLSFNVAKSSDLGLSFGVSRVSNMPLPAAPLSTAYCATFGFTADAAGTAACNAVPYFGTYTGIASDLSNDAYVAWTDTNANVRNFGVAGSQDVVTTFAK